jgi:steroid 5-alpha reductase family enzyme
MGLIFLFTLPILSAWQGSDTSLYWADYLIAGLMLLLIVLETISDQQQYDFQNEKYKKVELGQPLEGDYKRGFITSGLWTYSRHPNYTCEQLIWITFYLFSVSATGQWINWSIIGCILLVILFYSSAKFSENITSNKYPDYKKYQENTPMFIGPKNN